ncbi:MAG: H-type lectin domain-containing protein [Candidatus Thiodiazotropha sp.]
MNEDPANTRLVPMQMCASTLVLDQYADGWVLADSDGAAESRSFSQRVAFDFPFSFVPLVHVGLAGFDIDHCDSARLSVTAEAISNDGFTLVIRTWRQTRIYRVEIGWLALGSS